MFFTEEYNGRLELHETPFGKLTELGESVARVFVVEKVFERSGSFKQVKLPKRTRRFRTADGQLKSRDEMTVDERKELQDQMKRLRDKKKPA